MNCIIIDDEPLAREAMEMLVEENKELCLLSMFNNAVSAARFMEEHSVDLIFLDIQMPGVDGITLAKQLRQRNPKLALFFVTNYDEYQDDAMDLQAFRFFEKPFNANRLYAGLDKAMEYIDGAYIDIYLSDDGAQQRVTADNILYVTREGRRTSIVTTSAVHNSVDKFDDLCAKLPQLFFYPVHKSFFVNLHHVERYSYAELLLTNGAHIPIAPRKQSAFHKFWFEYLRRR